ncbi:uncharacterized protein LOC130704496 [Daphnia carinata]|uniref:uncharacterized protein LOC130704496 n=1 Tax=Daphnia carinata TaxID=120202 RepID=UPI0025799F3A|nr:uncharacterized protein LOC130704496 [Daphnia carinata]
MVDTRRALSSKLKKKLLEKLTRMPRLKMGNKLLIFFTLSYFAHMKQLAKMATLNSLMEKKRAIASKHVIEAHQAIVEKTKMQRKQRTLDEMLKHHSKALRSPTDL